MSFSKKVVLPEPDRPAIDIILGFISPAVSLIVYEVFVQTKP